VFAAALEIARLYATGAAYRTGLYERLLRRSGVTRRDYANLMNYLKASGRRPFPRREFQDRFAAADRVWQRLAIPDGASDEEHFEVWQRPEAGEYLLLSTTAKLSEYPLTTHRFIKHVPDGARVCEYGAGQAPITHAIRRFYKRKRLRVTIADIPTESFKMAKYLFRADPWVDTIDLEPGDDRPLTETYDVIFCITVFEHLPRPLALAKHFHERLRPGGKLIFDYLRTEGVGVDLGAAARERELVLSFIRNHFAGEVNAECPGHFVVTKGVAHHPEPWCR